MASSGLRKMLILITFQHWMVSECWCVLQFYGHSDILLLCFMADVISYVLWHIVCIGRCYCHMFGRLHYRYKCDRVECDEEYFGESARTFAERFKEHQKAPSSIYDDYNTSGHTVTIDNFNIVGRENHQRSFIYKGQ